MEKEAPTQMKKFLLAGFMLVSVTLIAFVWANALLDREPHGPSFYRATAQVDDTFYVTQTANAVVGTVVPTKPHKNEHATSRPAISTTMTAIPAEGVDQEN